MKKKIFLILFSIIAVIFCVVALSACSKVEDMLYDAPQNIVYDGQFLTWSKVENAKHYTVSINGGDAARSNSTTYTYISSDIFEATVTAVFDNTEKSTSVTFKPLTTIENIEISDDGEMSWNAVAGANAYILTINNGTITTTETRYTQLNEGSNRVKIKPIVLNDNTYYSAWSLEVNVYIYNKPTNIKYDGSVLTWAGNSSSYEVTINNATQTISGNSVNYNSENKDFTAEIKAIGNHTTTYDSTSVQEKFQYLDTVTGIFIEEGIIKWNAVQRAEGYKIKIGGIEQKVTVVNPEYTNLSSGISQDIAIMPFNNSGNYFSSWSAEKTVYILDTPIISWNNDLELDGDANNNLTWNAINAADGYTVRLIKGGGTPEISTYSNIQRAFANAYSSVGVYTVEVKANAESTSADYYDSKYSAPITIERLAAPEAVATDFIVSSRDNLSNGFTVNYVPVNGASGYQLYKDETLVSGKYTTSAALTDTNVAKADIISEQHFTYYIRSMGGVKTVSGNVYVTLPCLTSEALSFDITVQAAPQNPTMSGYTIRWDSVAGNNGYIVTYGGTSVTAQAESYDLSTLNAGTYSVAVCARGNGGNVLASNYSSPVAVQRLEAPTKIKISAENNGTLKWEDVSNATSYQAFLDLSSTPLDENAYSNMYQFIETNGTTLSMLAVANYYNKNRTLYYMTSQSSSTQQFIRLAAPTFPEGAVANSIELLWSTPANINTNEYTPTYQIYTAYGESIGGGAINGTKFNIEHLEGGKSYNFYVKAIGNATKYLDSDYSVAISVKKLVTPTLTINNGQYTWNSVADANSYYLEIDGKKASDNFHVSGSKYSYTPRYTTDGNHIVKLKAVGDGRNNLDSAEYVYTQKTRILLAPVIEYAYSSDSFVTGGSITVNITTPSANCSGYQYEIAGQTLTSNELSYSKTIQNTGNYTIRVKALGGIFDSDNIYYIDSLYSGGSATDVIVLLGSPSLSSFSITPEGTVKWMAVSGTNNYEYQLSFEGDEFGEIKTTGFNNMNIENHTIYATIRVKVRAKGNGNNVISSEWVVYTWTNPNLV